MKIQKNIVVHLQYLFICCQDLRQFIFEKKKYELIVDLEDFEGTKVYAKYNSFAISLKAVNAEQDGYKLQVDFGVCKWWCR